MAQHPHQFSKGALITSSGILADFVAAVTGTLDTTYFKSDNAVTGTSAEFDITKNGVSIYGTKPIITTGNTVASQSESIAVNKGDKIQVSVVLSGSLPSVGGKLYGQFTIEDGLPTYFGGTSTTSRSLGTGSKTFTTQRGLAYTVGSRIRVSSDSDPTNKYMEGVVTAYSGTTLTATMDLAVGSSTHTDWSFSLAGERGTAGATGATGPQGDPGVVESIVAGDNIDVDDTDPGNPIVHGITMVPIGVACSDESTAITTGTGKVTFRMPYDFDVYEVRANLKTASSSGGPFQVDINQNGTSIFGTDKLTIDDTEKTSLTATTAVDLTAPFSLDDDDEMTVDVDDHGTGAIGLKIWLIGRKRF